MFSYLANFCSTCSYYALTSLLKSGDCSDVLMWLSCSWNISDIADVRRDSCSVVYMVIRSLERLRQALQKFTVFTVRDMKQSSETTTIQ